MIVIGIDVLILCVFGCACVVASFVTSFLMRLSEREGIVSIVSTCITALSMVIAYVVMVEVLDRMLGVFGW